ncbi:hypothetical protein HPQ64_19785 [Rhizobiales bacterium]|uniref:hypothetical protein n=1 Tax=Hongsoonwoonella zoysiae TaxID=2821844 RepID=UPI0015616B1E|nr:hypothetical protein [Hongsoonwoonella zoysiae]NRG19941.1 hypothetical protein [Hongsoonwoonella zoysiae]
MPIETIADVKAQGARLAMLCHACGRRRYIRNAFSDKETLREIAARLKCHRCGSDDVELQALVRDASTGFWPAEHG